jgi:hypothetical protein
VPEFTQQLMMAISVVLSGPLVGIVLSTTQRWYTLAETPAICV